MEVSYFGGDWNEAAVSVDTNVPKGVEWRALVENEADLDEIDRRGQEANGVEDNPPA